MELKGIRRILDIYETKTMEEDKFSRTELLYLQMLIKQNLIDNQIDLIENDNSFKKMTTSLFDKVIRNINDLTNN